MYFIVFLNKDDDRDDDFANHKRNNPPPRGRWGKGEGEGRDSYMNTIQ